MACVRSGDEGFVWCACSARQRLRHVAHWNVTTCSRRACAQRSCSRLLRDLQIRRARSNRLLRLQWTGSVLIFSNCLNNVGSLILTLTCYIFRRSRRLGRYGRWKSSSQWLERYPTAAPSQPHVWRHTTWPRDLSRNRTWLLAVHVSSGCASSEARANWERGSRHMTDVREILIDWWSIVFKKIKYSHVVSTAFFFN